MLWLSTGGGKFGNMSMSLPLRGPAASTRIEGFGASDISDRLALLLCKKHNRQFFVNAHLPRKPNSLRSGETGLDELVLRKVVEEVSTRVKLESLSKATDSMAQLSLTSATA